MSVACPIDRYSASSIDAAAGSSQTPLADLRHDVDFEVTTVADPHDDDPSLALLFSQIKSLTLQTAKGSSEVPERTEFNFVLHNARVFTRMGETARQLPYSSSANSC